MLDDTRFIKRQQWATTNYVALIYAAIIWLGQKYPASLKLSCALSVVAVIAGVAAIGLLVAFQYDLCKLRKRIEITSNYCYAGQEKRAFDIKKDEHPFGRGWHILAALIAVCGFGAVLVLFVLD